MTDIPFHLKGAFRLLCIPLPFALRGVVTLPSPEEDKSGVVITLVHDDGSKIVFKLKGDTMAYTLPVDMKVGVRISYVDKAGNPAKVDGDVRWEESDKAIFLFNVDPNDSFQGTIQPQGALGLAQLKALADADIGEGVKALMTLFDLEIVGGEAVAGVITPVGEPEPQAAEKAKKR